MNLNYYEILGLPYQIDTNEINSSVKSIFDNSLIHQTDEYREKIYLAYETLSNEDKRKEYDKTLTKEDILSIKKNYELLKKSKNMFETLSKYTDKKIEVEYLWDHKTKTVSDKLIDFLPYEYLEFGNKTIPFIGKASGIIKITDLETGNILYENENINQDYNKTTQELKIKQELSSWGICIAYKHYDSWLKKIAPIEEKKSVIRL